MVNDARPNVSTVRRMAWDVLVVIAVIVLMAGPGGAVPVCDWQSDVTQCSIEQQSDFAALPTNVTSLRVYFPPGHRTTLSHGVFPVRPNLRTLVVDLNNVNHDPQGVVFGQLTALTELTMVNTDIYAPRQLELPAMVFSGLKKLRRIRMRQVGLSQVDQTTFHDLPSLEELNLGLNDLSSFPGAAFTGTPNIVELVLSNNKLSALVDGTFVGLTKLQKLNLDDNKLRVLGRATFGNLPALETLSLKKNDLRSVGLGTFQQLPLQTLLLQNNRLGRIDANIFIDLSSLNTLDISKNNLTEVADLAFTDLTNLKFLEIFENSLKTLSPMTFQGLSKLVFLDLYINNFTELQDDVFRDLTGLSTLHLHNASIQRVSVGAFNGLKTLNVLTLQGNNMKTLPEGVFRVFEQLGFLDISHNPWNCTCELTWIHLWSDDQSFGSEPETKCASDGEALLQYARDNYYACRRTTTPATTTALPVTTVAVVADSTSAPLIKFTSSVEPGDGRGNGSAFIAASFGKTDLIILICVASAAFILAVIIAVLIIYCRQKKCAFWTPEHVSAIPTTPASAGLEKDINHFAYSPTKEQSFFADQAGESLDRKAKTGSVHIDRHHRLDSAYDNPALYIEDIHPNNHHHQADPAVVAYVSENGVAHRNGDARKHSYEHRVSDSGTHYVDRVSHPSAPNEIHLNDLSRPENNSDSQPKSVKKEKKRKHGKKPKKASVSSSDNGGDDPYREVYALPTDIPLTNINMTPTPAPRPSLQKKHHIHKTSLESSEYNTHEDYAGRFLERDSALGASTEEPFEDYHQPPSPGLDNPDHAPSNINHSPQNLDQGHYPEADEGEDQDYRRLEHTDSLGGNSDYVDYRYSYENKPLY